MGWFRKDDDDEESGGRWGRSYGAASRYAIRSPTTVGGACLTLIWVGIGLYTKRETLQSVGGEALLAISFIIMTLLQNIHLRKNHRETSEALEEVKAARAEAAAARAHIETAQGDLSVNTAQTVSAAESAAKAAQYAENVERLVAQLNAKFDKLQH